MREIHIYHNHYTVVIIRENNRSLALQAGIYKIGKGTTLDIICCLWRWYLHFSIE